MGRETSGRNPSYPGARLGRATLLAPSQRIPYTVPMRWFSLCFGLLLFAASPAAAGPAFTASSFAAEVVAVRDGDTILVLYDGKRFTVRLAAIDCPERGQAYWDVAKRYTESAALGKTVMVDVTGKDRYGRTLAEVTLPDGKNLNRDLIRAGLAWWYRRGAPEDKELEALEAEARRLKLGLWVDPNPFPPWEWRGI